MKRIGKQERRTKNCEVQIQAVFNPLLLILHNNKSPVLQEITVREYDARINQYLEGEIFRQAIW